MQDMDKLHELGDEELEVAIGGLDLEAILLALEQRQEEGSLSGKMLNGTLHPCTGPRTHVRTTGQIKGFCLLDHFVYDRKNDRYLLIGCVGEDTAKSMQLLDKLSKLPQDELQF